MICKRVAFVDLFESPDMVEQLFRDWRTYSGRAPGVPVSWAMMGLVPVREQALPMARQLLQDVEPPGPKGRAALEAFVASAAGDPATSGG